MKWLGIPLKLTIATALACVLAVLASQRGHAEAPSDQFQLSNNTVTDTKTGLIWQRNVAIDMGFEEAQTYCANLTLDGATTWRLPSIKELQTLVDDEKPAFTEEETAFPKLTDHFWIWSSTPVAGNPSTMTWFLDFRLGITSSLETPDPVEFAVRCVR